MKKKRLTNKAGRVRELKREDIRAMRPAREVLPSELVDILPKRKPGQRGPQKQPKKIPVTVRYSPEVIKYFKATGKGWQMRMDKILKNWVSKHSKAA